MTENAGTDFDSVATELEDYSRVLGGSAFSYWEGQKPRFKFLATLIGEIIENNRKAQRPVVKILDIGNSYQTLIVNRMWPTIQLDTLGFLHGDFKPMGKTVHFEFDLNDAYDPEHRITFDCDEKYELILFLEVIEHLYTAPELILDFVRSLLKPGGRLIIQTPNAASLIKRLILVMGRNPFELIRTTRENPGHFREYTKAELIKLALQSGFIVENVYIKDYFRARNIADRISYAVSRILPATFKSGVTLVLTTPQANSHAVDDRLN